VADIASNLEQLKDEIRSVAMGCGRDPEDIQLLAVTKTQPSEVVQEALDEGQKLFGENRIQEADQKISQLRASDLSWHMIGPLQSNKARRAVELFEMVQTVDRAKIARKLSQHAQELERTLEVLIEVNVGSEPQKHGVLCRDLHKLAALVDELPALELQGLMTVPPYREDPEESRPYFSRLTCLLRELNQDRQEPLRQLSMGMSHDYKIAIQEGATLIRVGTALFGRRNP